MDDKSFNIRVPKKWARTGLIALVLAVIAAPLTALAAHQFTDVPDSNIFHADISWMADAGVTLGCNAAHTQYCPGDSVSRGQMAAFMHRLAVNQVVDAGELDGADSTAYRAVSSGANCDQTAPNDCPVGGTLATLTIDAPAAGIVTLNYQISMLELNSGQVTVQAWANADDTCDWFLIPLDSLLGSLSVAGYADLTGTLFHSISGTTNISVAAGTSTHSVCAAIIGAEANYASIDAVWTPEGTGISAASADEVMTFPDGFGSEFEGKSVAGFDN